MLAADGSWTDVVALRPNKKIQVVKRNRKCLQGEVVGANSEKITLTVGGQGIAIAKADVVRVSLSAGRGRNALISAPLQQRGHNKPVIGNQPLAAFLAFGDGIGAAIGASQTHFQTIYRAP